MPQFKINDPLRYLLEYHDGLVFMIFLIQLNILKMGIHMSKKVIVKIDYLLEKYDISLRKLSRLADVRHAALSELSNCKRQNINFGHIERIAKALNIDDIRDIIDLVDTNS